MSYSVTRLSLSESGASLVNALAILRVKPSLRMLPTMTTTLCGVAMGFPFEGAPDRRAFQPSELGKRCKCMNCRSRAREALICQQNRPPMGTACFIKISRATIKSPDSWQSKSAGIRSRPSLRTLVRIDQVLFAGGALAVDGNVIQLQRLLQ